MGYLHAIGFYVSSGVLLAGALGVALMPGRGQRGAALGVAGLGLAGVFLFLSAGFAAGIALLCYAGAAFLVAAPQYRSVENVASAAWRRDLTAALAGCPLMFGGAAVALVGIARFSAAGGPHLFGQAFAGLLAISALALVALGIGISGREGSR